MLVVAASHLSGEVAALHHLGAEHRNFEPKPPGMSIFANRRVQQAVRDLIAAWQTDTTIVSGAALASLAARAARKAGVKKIVTIVSAEMGVGSDEERRQMVTAFRGAVKLSQAVVCHNAEDARVLTLMLKPKSKRVIVTPGDGVDLTGFAVAPMPPADAPLTFLMIANPDARGAIEAYTEAARALTGKGLAVRCVLATDREAAQDTTLLTVESIAFEGRAADPAAMLGTVHVVVHLSADDGSPDSFEASACGWPAGHHLGCSGLPRGGRRAGQWLSGAAGGSVCAAGGDGEFHQPSRPSSRGITGGQDQGRAIFRGARGARSGTGGH